MKEQLDKIQIEFFKTYNKFESEELVIESMDGDDSKWSSSPATASL